ncbi:tripartite motif-containing protein 2-like [Ptychodera flava]|uniref:tripartite motif-containing protein 2-like n=1 Tax=Ptychodera flava TaxID=63121 RepID=UPI003969D217
MAAKESFPEPLAEIDENFLLCVICSERYKGAKVLPCLHSFCEACLCKLVKKNSSLTCPVCRRSHDLSDKGVAGISSNIFLNDLVGLFSERDKEDESIQPPIYCSKHPNYETEFYCDTCAKVICLKCTALDHRTHKYGCVKEAAEAYNKTLVSIVDKVKVKEVEADQSLIQENGDKILAELKNEYGTRKVNLNAQLKQLEIAEQDITSTREYIEKLIRYGNSAQLMAAKKDIAAQTDDLLEEVQVEPVEDEYIEFVPCDDFCKEMSLGVVRMNLAASFEIGDIPECSTVGEEITVILMSSDEITRQTINSGLIKVDAVMITPYDKEMAVEVGDFEDGTVTLRTSANIEGEHELHVRVRKQPVQGSPAKITIIPIELEEVQDDPVYDTELEEVQDDPVYDTELEEVQDDPVYNTELEEVQEDPVYDTELEEVQDDPLYNTELEEVQDDPLYNTELEEVQDDPVYDTELEEV